MKKKTNNNLSSSESNLPIKDDLSNSQSTDNYSFYIGRLLLLIISIVFVYFLFQDWYAITHTGTRYITVATEGNHPWFAKFLCKANLIVLLISLLSIIQRKYEGFGVWCGINLVVMIMTWLNYIAFWGGRSEVKIAEHIAGVQYSFSMTPSFWWAFWINLGIGILAIVVSGIENK